MRQRIHFMATAADVTNLMKSIEAQKPLKYTRREFADEPILQQAGSFANIASFGLSKHGNMILDDAFLISEPSLEIKIDPIPQNKGGIKYKIATPSNPKTLLLSPGGSFEGDTVISGELMKYSDEPEAKEMFKIFRREVNRQFKKHRSYPYWIGPEAFELHAAGNRLTNDVKSTFSLPLE